VELDQLPHECKAKTKILLRRPDRSVIVTEGLEDDRQQIRRDTEAVVADDQLGMRAVGPGLHIDVPASRRELDRVVDDIANDLPKA